MRAGKRTKLTEKQERALRACESPHGAVGVQFWHDARASWQGPRRTLGSLYMRGLVDYNDPGGWTITEAGLAALADP